MFFAGPVFPLVDQLVRQCLLASPDPALTDRNLLQSIPCRGEKYHETAVGGIRYMISTQEEQLSQTLYDANRHEITT